MQGRCRSWKYGREKRKSRKEGKGKNLPYDAVNLPRKTQKRGEKKRGNREIVLAPKKFKKRISRHRGLRGRKGEGQQERIRLEKKKKRLRRGRRSLSYCLTEKGGLPGQKRGCMFWRFLNLTDARSLSWERKHTRGRGRSDLIFGRLQHF